MASRMERYYKDELLSVGRSSRNKNLYKQIENIDSYSNIEEIVSIENNNEIDISRVKEMIKNREEYKRQKELSKINDYEKKEVQKEVKLEPEPQPMKVYDINSLLTMAKETEPVKEEHHSLTDSQYKLLKSLNKKGKDYDLEKEEAELKELINTITSKNALNDIKEESDNINNIASDDDDVGLLDDLKSNTMVGDASSIKKIISEEKYDKLDDTTKSMDKTFLTTSMGFTKTDFTDFSDINFNKKDKNKIIIILFLIVVVLVIAILLFILFK